MGFFNRKRTLENTPQVPASTLGREDTLPATSDTLGRMKASGNAALTKAGDFYKKNPKLVGGVALLASALLLNRLKRPHH